jgi:O-antigen/teichoic acid export membrane protein
MTEVDDIHNMGGVGDAAVNGDDEASRFRRGLGRTGISSIINIIIGVAAAVLISRRFGGATFGEFVTVAAPVALLSLLSTTQEQVGFLQTAAPLSNERGRFSALAARTALFSESLTVLASLILLPASWWFLRGPADSPELVGPAFSLIAAYVMLGNPVWNLDGVLIAKRASGALSTARTLDAVAQPGLTLLASLATRSVWAFVIGMAATYLLGLIVRVAAARSHLGRPGPADWAASKQDFRHVVKVGVHLLPGSWAGGLIDQTAPWIIRSVVGGGPSADVIVGAFGRASNLTSRLQEFTYRISALLLPSLSDRWSARDVQGHRATLRIAVARYLYPLGALACVLAGCAPNLLAVFGEDFVSGAAPMRLLLCVSVLLAIDIVGAMSLISVGKSHLPARTTILGAIVLVAAIVPLTQSYGATGAAGAVLIGQVVSTTWRLPLVDRWLPGGLMAIMPQRWPMLGLLAATAGLATWLIARPDDGLVRGIVAGCVGVVIAGAALPMIGTAGEGSVANDKPIANNKTVADSSD